MIIDAVVTRLAWDEKETAVQEATLEVKHENGDTQYFVIPIISMTDRIKSAQDEENELS